MKLSRVLIRLADASRRSALLVVLAGILLAVLSGFYAAGHLGVTTDTDQMFSNTLPWRQHKAVFEHDFPQFNDLLVAVIDARIPEEADATAAALAKALSADRTHFISVTRPDNSAYLRQEGLMFLDVKQLTTLMNQTIDAQPFLGQLVADPSARGLFASLALLGMGVTHGDVDLSPYLPALAGFHRTMAAALAGHPQPLSWQSLLGGEASKLAGPYRFVLVRPKLDYGQLQPGGAATAALRRIAADLPFVQAGSARVRVTGSVALSDEEFASVAHNAVYGLVASILLITLWLFLAVRTWRLILPILGTLVLGLMLTLLFASVAVGTLNLVSVGFGILFVGLAVDFSIQFAVRYREARHVAGDPGLAMIETTRRTGGAILVAATATAAGFLAFVPTAFSGVAELGLIAGIGMLIAFACTITFLPAAIALCHPKAEAAEVGFAWAAPLDPLIGGHRRAVLAGFAALAVLALAMAPRLGFDSDPLHTKNPHTEAMRTLRDLMNNPLTNPYSIDVLTKNAAAAAALGTRLAKLPTVAQVISIDSFVPQDQAKKLAIVADANSILAPTLMSHPDVVPATPGQIRLAARTALAQLTPALSHLPPGHPLAAIAGDLHALEAAPDATVMVVNTALTEFLPTELHQLRTALSAAPVTLASIPPEIARNWLLPDGQARVQVTSKAAVRDSAGLHEFVAQVRKVAPDAGGSAVTIVATSATIVGAFRQAAIGAVIAIAVILFIALRRLLDVGLVMAPLLLSALLTVLVVVACGIQLNFANIIALPLLLGVGVSFNIYFVMNWRAGRTMPLGSATARAIVFSALTTGTAFGSLALSDHPGTASMGTLLLISLGCTLVASLIFVPALLAVLGKPTAR